MGQSQSVSNDNARAELNENLVSQLMEEEMKHHGNFAIKIIQVLGWVNFLIMAVGVGFYYLVYRPDAGITDEENPQT